LIFSNVDYLETQVLDSVRKMPKLRYVLIVANGMNEIDSSGVDALSVLIDRLHGQGIRFAMSGCNDHVLDVLKRTGLVAKIGENNLYRNVERAMSGIWETAHANVEEEGCPLKVRRFEALQVDEASRRALMKHDREQKDEGEE
jgi:MFS superfamily sulfate permease-like transporter